MRPNALIIENGYATIGIPGGAVFTTTHLKEGRYVRVDDGRQYPQLCANASFHGNTLEYHGEEQLARDCNARLFKTRRGFDLAVKRMTDEYPD